MMLQKQCSPRKKRRIILIPLVLTYAALLSALWLLAGNGFSRPIVNAAEFHNVCVAQPGQFLRCLFAAVAAAAVHQNQLFFIRKFLDFI